MALSPSARRFKRRWALLGVLLAVFSLGLGAAVLAVHDDGFFEIDGNSVEAAAAGDDWDTLNGSSCGPGSPGSATAELAVCVPDVAPETAFQGGGSKDDNDINLWKWANAPSGVSPGKDDIQNAYAALYVDAAGDRFVYFGMDVKPSTGTRQVGFWFLQDPAFGLDADNTFSGVHVNNDVLVQSNFTQGGSVTNLSVFRWFNGNLELLSSTNPGDNEGCNTSDTVCVAVNDTPTTLSWRAGEQAIGDFFEGGIKLDGAPINFDPEACLANFVAETRSSPSFSARLKDFATGDFDTCAKPTSVTTNLSGGGESGASITVPIGTEVTDTATISGDNAATAGGTVTYKVYSDDTCTTEVFDAGTKTVTNGVGAASDAFTPTAAGTFYWQASYSGDDDNEPSVSTCDAEVLTVTKNQPGNSTAQSLIPDDAFTLSGATSDAGGTVNFYLFAPGDTCDETNTANAAFSEEDVALTGNTTASTSNAASATPFVAQTAGTWTWLAIYSGDDNNEATTSDCVETFTIDNDGP